MKTHRPHNALKTDLPKDLLYEIKHHPRTERGAALLAIRKQMEKSNETFLTDEEVLEELRRRRGGAY